MIALDFESKILELEKKIDDLKKDYEENKVNDYKLIETLNSRLKSELEKIYSQLDPWQITLVARHPERPKFLDYVNMIFSDFIEIHGDRSFGDDKAIITGFAKINDEKVFIIGQQKGKDIEDSKKYRFGMPNPEGYRKALRVMKIAEKFNRPILTFIDTPGAFPGIDAEERGQGEAIARNLKEMANLKVPVIATVIGEGGSGGALGIGVANFVYMLKYSIYSVISPEGCASILFRDSSKASEAAKSLKLTAKDLLELGIIDGIIDEPAGGAHRYPREVAQNLKNKLMDSIIILKKLSKEKLKERRIEKFLKIGYYTEKSDNN
ncbi:MAG TPA: acetyl-CoA carboxylase carboxyltransferase subunit alpha [Spirochaetota bacterium]|nr:acetyl-CoA carboxylase carboxyltransferase subunit alpha [Spirochaetota bacterium]HOM38961.1 acetyl-CoA carboxylase carboxyltransferase subunit alpha [Spirochaetota bacterium]HPQ49219.1 acetyl-CoA carboxylase carboxyltransferase subunit alpha [Spirochaetota bacterium]